MMDKKFRLDKNKSNSNDDGASKCDNDSTVYF